MIFQWSIKLQITNDILLSEHKQSKGGFTHNNDEDTQEFTQTLPEQDVPDSEDPLPSLHPFLCPLQISERVQFSLYRVSLNSVGVLLKIML